MPPLQAFGRKWRVGSDDFVFPYCISIILRLVWFILITIVLVDYDRNYVCQDERLLKRYLFVLTGLHFIMIILEAIVVLISCRGTIANPEPRKRLPILLYIQFGFFVLEFGWDVVGVWWAYDPSIDCHQSHQVLIFTRIVLVWNMCVSLFVGFYMIIRIGVCSILSCCFDPEKKFCYEKYDPITSYDGFDLPSLSNDEKIRHRYQRTWQCRVHCLNCLICLKGGQSNIYADVSATLSDMFTYFRGYVPSDIVAGIAIHAMHNGNKVEFLNSYTRRLLDFRSPPTRKHFGRVVRYIKFAAAAYGLEAYCHSKGIFCSLPIYLKAGLCNWFCKCMLCHRKAGGDIHGECCGKNVKTIQLVTGILEEDVIYSSFSSEVYCPAFYVAYDHEMRSVIVAVRGTFSFSDVFTNLTYEPQLFQTHEEGDIYGHKGMLSGAHGLLLKIDDNKILQKAFKQYPSYRLVIVGHSMGAAIASLLAIILKPHYPRLHCFAYSPPGCVINMGAVAYSRSFITSVVFENDIIPRFSAENFEKYSLQILHCIQTSHVPKYRIMLDSFLYWIGLCRPFLSSINRMKSITDLTIEREELRIDADYEENDVYDVVADARKLLSTDQITRKARISPRNKVPLFIPGRIIHVTWKKPVSRCCGLIKTKSLQAHWTVQSEFNELDVQDGMIRSHFPYSIMKHLIELEKSADN